MDPAIAMLLGKLIDAALTITNTLTDFGVNYREVMDEQEAAAAEGREINTDMFIDQAQDAVDQL